MLDQKISIYVPSNMQGKTDYHMQSYFVEQSIRLLASLCGGASSHPISGSWIMEDGELVTESVIICYAFTNAANLENVELVARELCAEIADCMRQESVALEVNGSLYFVESVPDEKLLID